MKDYLFVYGTLAKEIAPREIAAAVKKLKDVGQGFILGRLYDIGEYPGAVLNGDPQDKIFGRIYQLPGDPEVLDRLDKYEGFDPTHPAQSAFVRRRTSINGPKKTRRVGLRIQSRCWLRGTNKEWTVFQSSWPVIGDRHSPSVNSGFKD
jgi:gamma-glutamylcyclotransferase (GGCT)/AIG2-like uncharacterized protein YtfP